MRRRLLAVGLALAACARQAPPDFSLVSAQQSRLTLEKDDGATLAAVDRERSPDLYYRVTLENAPLGTQLDLSCDWIDPAGRVAH